jgi:2-oxoisovalerate dehydrogenase E2 component (dihydrolipoyl transacylase)
MAEHVIKLPDIGEGVAEAELVEWHVKTGDLVREDAILAAVMTDKATVEIPSPIDGEVLWLGARVGDMVPVGSELVRLKVAEGEAAATARAVQDAPIATAPALHIAEPEPVVKKAAAEPAERRTATPPAATADEPARAAPPRLVSRGAPRPEGERPLAAPAVRLRAREAGIDLRQVAGTGPAGRITHEDLDAFFAHGPPTTRMPALQARTSVEDIRVVGLRRRIAEKMSIAKSRIPHITYVEEIDVTAVEELRATLNQQKRQDQPRLTLLPFLMRAIVRAVAEQPGVNALFDDEAGVLHQHAGVHIGIATQTPAGLMVPVVKHAEALDLWACSTELNRLAQAARAGTAAREELTGSTITITSLGAMGGVMSTPIINHPEVAIVGVNKIMVRPVWDGSTFIPRRMMNLSSGFDHRVVDGWDAAVFVQRIKTLLETPALIFMDD